MAATPLRIGFVGAGNMAQALVKGIISSGLTAPQNIITSSPRSDQHLLDQMQSLGCHTTHSNVEAGGESDVVVVSVKPNIVGRVMEDLRPAVSPKSPLVTSVALGVTVGSLEGSLPREARVVRVMPNTAALVNTAASVFCLGSHATPEDAELTHKMLSAVGQSEEVPETYLDAVTGLSGAGPAYVFVALEALADGGVRMGLPRNLSLKLAAQTLIGAARMVLETGKHPAQLKDEVCSPGGCTIRGLQALEQGGLRSAFINAVEAAAMFSATTAQAK